MLDAMGPAVQDSAVANAKRELAGGMPCRNNLRPNSFRRILGPMPSPAYPIASNVGRTVSPPDLSALGSLPFRRPCGWMFRLVISRSVLV